MKKVCLDFQDCGFSEELSKQQIKNLAVDEPFAKCPLCGYYALITNNPIPEQIDLKSYIKLLKNFENKEE